MGNTILRVYGTEGLSEKEISIINQAVDLGNKVLPTDIFRNKIKALDGCRENRGYDGDGILKLIEAGLGPDASHNGIIALDFRGFYEYSSCIAYTLRGSLATYVNRKFLGSFTVQEVFDFIMHEYCHRLKFVHTSWFRSRNLQTVPYQVGYASRDAMVEFLKAQNSFVGTFMSPNRVKIQLAN
jgi:hypothetical protein